MIPNIKMPMHCLTPVSWYLAPFAALQYIHSSSLWEVMYTVHAQLRAGCDLSNYHSACAWGIHVFYIIDTWYAVSVYVDDNTAYLQKVHVRLLLLHVHTCNVYCTALVHVYIHMHVCVQLMCMTQVCPARRPLQYVVWQWAESWRGFLGSKSALLTVEGLSPSLWAG